MSPERIPTETSPLLGEESNALPGSTGALFNTDYHQSPENDLLEQQGRVDAESQQGKDLPLRYIVPAVSIGVCCPFILITDVANTSSLSDLPFSCRPNYYHGQLWADWE